MEDSKEKKYIGISVPVLRKFDRPLAFNIYIKRTEADYSKLFNENDKIDWERLKSYESKGVEFLFILAEDYGKYAVYLEALTDQLLETTNKFSLDETVVFLKEMVNYSMFEIMVKINIDERVVTNAAKIVTGLIDNLKVEPKQMTRLVRLMASHPYIFKHSITVSIFSVLLAKASGMESSYNLNLIGLGAFLHDVGLSQLTFDPDDQEVLTPEQRREMWRHPELGKRQLDHLKGMRSEILDIVLQHHEQPNGGGYPNGLRGAEIYGPAKIVAIADSFSSLISKRSFREAFSPEEALKVMSADVGKFDKDLLRTFIQFVLPRS